MEVLVDSIFMVNIELDKLNSSSLISDIKNNNILGCVLRTEGYVGNRPSNFKGEFHEDDTWAIDVIHEEGQCETSYLYVSEFEYDEDVKILKEFK